MASPPAPGSRRRRPLGLRWRSSYWFATFVVGLGVATDLLVYSIIISVMPFQLQRLGYTGVSALMGWLLCGYSAGLAAATIPVAMFSERYNTRRTPLIIGLVVLVGSQIMLMEAPKYSVMCIARILQGAGSSMVWVVGLALVCDCTPEIFIGRQLGIAMAGVSIGVLIGPPVGGALYSHLGFRAPFIFGIGAAVLDLIGRLLIVERREALYWGVDPAALPESHVEAVNNTEDNLHLRETGSGIQQIVQKADVRLLTKFIDPSPQSLEIRPQNGNTAPPAPPKPLSLVAVIIQLSKSPRALVALVVTFIYGVVYSSQEPALPLHLQAVWGLDSSQVGLVFLAAVVPTLFSSPLAGWYADRKGSEWIAFWSLALALPWWVIVIIQGHLALFVTSFAVENFFTSGVISPLTAELATVSRGIEGVGYGHVYGAFCFAYGIGTSVGPVIGGQVYDHVKHGWTALCLLATGLLVLSVALAFRYTGDDPLSGKLTRRLKSLNERRSLASLH